MPTKTIIGLVTSVALIGMSCLGPSPAPASTTQLCKVHTATTCPAGQATTSLHMVNSGLFIFYTNNFDILCLSFLELVTPLALASQQLLHASARTMTKCGTSASHNECVITTEVQPLRKFLYVALDVATVTSENGVFRVKCTFFGFIKIDCKYGDLGWEVEFEGGNPATMTMNEKWIEQISGSALCPEETLLSGTLQSLEEVHVLQ
jgi:hypothetical protein